MNLNLTRDNIAVPAGEWYTHKHRNSRLTLREGEARRSRSATAVGVGSWMPHRFDDPDTPYCLLARTGRIFLTTMAIVVDRSSGLPTSEEPAMEWPAMEWPAREWSEKKHSTTPLSYAVPSTFEIRLMSLTV